VTCLALLHRAIEGGPHFSDPAALTGRFQHEKSAPLIAARQFIPD
jgi:hypothetical protein